MRQLIVSFPYSASTCSTTLKIWLSTSFTAILDPGNGLENALHHRIVIEWHGSYCRLRTEAILGAISFTRRRGIPQAYEPIHPVTSFRRNLSWARFGRLQSPFSCSAHHFHDICFRYIEVLIRCVSLYGFPTPAALTSIVDASFAKSKS